MNSKRPLAPGFINTLDNYLLKNNPVTWTCRTHLVVYYSLLFSFVLAVLCFIVPSDPREDSFSFAWTSLSIICSIIALVIYCIYLFRFNVFKRFGIDKTWNGLKIFALFFISISFLVLPCFTPAAVESVRANMAYSYKEIKDDVNAINIKINQLYYDSLNHKWSEETYIVRDTVPFSTPVRTNSDTVYIPEASEGSVIADTETTSENEQIMIIDTARLKEVMFRKDSMVKINDSVYKFYTCPDYAFLDNVGNYGIQFGLLGSYSYYDTVFYTSKDIYYNLIKKFKPVNRASAEKELQDLLLKYKTKGYTYDYDYDEDKYSINRRIEQRYHLTSTGNSVSNILDKKLRWQRNNDSRIRLWFYITLITTLLLFIFRHSTTKTFFLTILTGFILMILTGVFMAFNSSGSKSFYIILLFYYSAFVVMTTVGYYRTIRNAVSGIALNMITFFTFLLPLIILLLMYEFLDTKEYDLTGKITYTHWDENRQLYFLIAEITGIVLLFILIEPLFKKLYRNWYSKPEE
jgi:hypothetical protein